jgi:hypothetical protein
MSPGHSGIMSLAVPVGESAATGIVGEAIEDGVGVGRITDHLMPFGW